MLIKQRLATITWSYGLPIIWTQTQRLQPLPVPIIQHLLCQSMTLSKRLCVTLCMFALLWTNSGFSTELPTLQVVTSLNQSAMSDRIEKKLSKAYQTLGYRIQVQRLPAGRSLMMANAGDFDAELFRIAEVAQQYPQLLRVPTPLERINLFAFVKRDSTKSLSAWQQDTTLKIAYVRGFKMAEHYSFAGKAVPVNTVNQAVQMLLQGKVNVLLEDPESVASTTIELSPDGMLKQLPSILATADLFHFIHKKHEALVAPLAASLQMASPR